MLSDLKDLSFYLKSAENVICKWGNKAMLNSEDTIADVAHMMMKADANFDGRGSIDGHRMSYARFGILDAITKYKKNKSKGLVSLNTEISNSDGKNITLEDTISNSNSPDEEFIKQDIVNIIMESNLKDREKFSIIRYYIYGDTYQQIGDAYGITAEAIRQKIVSGINKLKDILAV